GRGRRWWRRRRGWQRRCRRSRWFGWFRRIWRRGWHWWCGRSRWFRRRWWRWRDWWSRWCRWDRWRGWLWRQPSPSRVLRRDRLSRLPRQYLPERKLSAFYGGHQSAMRAVLVRHLLRELPRRYLGLLPAKPAHHRSL